MSVRTQVTKGSAQPQELPVFVIGKTSGSVYVKATADGELIYVRIGRGSGRHHKDEALGYTYVGKSFANCFEPFIGRLIIDVD